MLLSILRLGDDAYAVSVRDEIARCTGREVSRGSIYITLDRLETKGYLKSRLADPTPERGGRSAELIAALRDAGWDGTLDVEIFSTPDAFWALPVEEAARRAYAATSALS